MKNTTAKYDRIKVISATKARDREALGETVTDWLRGYEGEVVDKIVTQSSDHAFHCLVITLFCVDAEAPPPRRTRRKKNGG